MMTALHVVQGAHVRCLDGHPAAGDPPLDRLTLIAQFINAEIVVCNPSLSAADIASARTHAPNAEFLASLNAHAWPKDVGPTNPWYMEFRDRLVEGVRADSVEYDITISENGARVILVFEQMTPYFDGTYCDELWATLPLYLEAQWLALGVTSSRTRKWPAFRDAMLEAHMRPIVANTGPISANAVAKYRHDGAQVSIEAEHGSPSQIVRALCGSPEKGIVWPERTVPLPEVYTMLPEIVTPGVFLPPA